MKVPFITMANRAVFIPVCLLAATFFISSARAQVRPTHRPEVPNIDKRTAAPGNQAEAAQLQQGKDHLLQLAPSAVVEIDELLGTPEFVRTRDGFLTGANGEGRAVSARAAQAFSADDPYRSVKSFLSEHAKLYGHGAEVLTDSSVARDSVTAHNSLRTVVWQQRLDGIPVFESVLIGNISRNGELVSISSKFLPNPGRSADAGTPNRQALVARPGVSAEEAIILAARDLGETLSVADVGFTGELKGGDYGVFKIGQRDAYARMVWLPMNRAVMRLAWQVIWTTRATHEVFHLLVDARSGEILIRRGMTEYLSDATYNVYTSDSPSPFSPGFPVPTTAQPPLTNRVLVTISALDVTASPNGWINDGDNDTQGNNADTFLDRNFDQQPDAPRPTGNPTRVFDFPLDLTQDPLTYSNAAIVQMFYWLNWYHDRVYQLGFTESAGNYQVDNFGRGGLGNDNIIGYVQAGADIGLRDNAFFIPAPDGFNGQIAMFTWGSPTPNRDGDLDAEVILHEATHGTSGRLVGGGVLISALQTSGMGEGWSDFYGESLLSQPGDDPDAVYADGGYVTFRLGGMQQNYYFGIRHFPYTTDMNKNPFTFKDIDPGQISSHPGVPRSPIYPFNANEANEVHHQGEVWFMALWEVRANLIHKYGPSANQLTLQLVTDGMKLGPANPNFLQARDAIILADQVDTGGANFLEIWRGFAKRGMGVSATSPSSRTTAGVHESFDLPGVNLDFITVSGGNGNGVIDFNECNELTIALANHGINIATTVSARLSSVTPEVVIAQPLSAYPNISPGATNVNTVPFKISTSPDFICGTPIACVLIVKSDQATITNQFVLKSGQTNAPMRFDNNNAVQIPDNYLPGTNSSVTVTNVLGAVSKVTVSLYLTHTFDSDLTLQLISPEGITNTLSSNNGSSGDNYGTTCSSEGFRTTFDDEAPTTITAGAPPYIGSYKPEQPLSIFAGKSGTNVNGVWSLHVVDGAAIDVGTIQCWSLNLYTPQCIDGGGECPGADLAIGMTAAPDPAIVGNPLTYTLLVTNNGPSAAKNVQVSHLLPSGSIFVSATSSQGACSRSGDVVSCALGNLAARHVASITVVIVPSTAGLAASSASVTADQADFDTSNNTATLNTLVNVPTSDLALGLSAAPDNVVVGGTLTYSVAVTNKGPSTASGLVVTNVLPTGVSILNTTLSQGTVSTISNVVICAFGTLTNGGTAAATITTTPVSEGSLVATSTAVANQADPNTANNSVTVTTAIGPAADLGVAITDSPDPVVVRSNLTYVVTVTNRGPSVANGVVLNFTLPAAPVVSSTTTRGIISTQGNVLTCTIGSLVNGGNAIVTVIVAPTNNGTVTASAAVGGSQTDPNGANNNASATTQVSPPFVTISAAGATLTAESFAPADGTIENGETVTVSLRLRNAGNTRNTNLVATLLATNGVTPSLPNNPQTYGVLAPSGFPVGRSFSFTAGGTNGGTIIAVLQLQDGTANLGTVSFNFSLPEVHVFSNTAAINIRDNTNALPYPSQLTVSGITNVVGKVTLTLSNASHTFPQDIDSLVVGPGSQKTILMAGAGASMSGADVTFDDAAANPIPDGTGQILTGSYRPADYSGLSLPAPAPAGPYGSPAMSVFSGVNPNGVWSLYVADHSAGDVGQIAGGWSLAVTTINPVNQIADLAMTATGSANPILAGANLTYIFTVTNNGPGAASFLAFSNTIPAGVSLISATSSQGTMTTNSGVIVGNLGDLAAGATATITLQVVPGAAASGTLTNTATISATENDLNLANNTASVVTAVNLPVADVGLTQNLAPTNVFIGANLTNIIVVTNRGPGMALDVVVTNVVPAGMAFVSADTSVGTATNSGGGVVYQLGNLVANGNATLTLVLNATNLGAFTNAANVATHSSDTNSANNQVSTTGAVIGPAPVIVAVSAGLTGESGPVNGAIDSGETVTVTLALRNDGTLDANNVVATLQNSGGVTPVGLAQKNYGTLVHGGPASTNAYSFTANGPSGGTVTATLQLANGLGNVSFAFTLPATTNLSNTASITIPDHGAANLYPSTIAVSGLTGLVTKASVTLNGLSHSFPRDVNVLLVSPTGGKTLLMSHTGGGHGITNLSLTFDDGAAGLLPATTQISSGSYQPTSYAGPVTFPSPAPAQPYGTTLSSVAGRDPNGNWSLFVFDDSNGDAGSIGGGWTLNLTTAVTINNPADLAVSMSSTPASLYAGAVLTNTINVTNLGPSAATGVMLSHPLGAGVSFVSVSGTQGSLVSSGGGVVTYNVGSLSVGGSARVAIVVAPSFGGFLTNSVSVAGNETDIDSNNNVAQTVTTVISPLPAHLTAQIVAGQMEITVSAEPGLTYILQGSTNLLSWVPISTNTAGTGTFKVVDPSSTSLSARYYRAVRRIP